MFIDFGKAFDTLSHQNLLTILERNGIRGVCLEWFQNYLKLRTYRVKICDTLSNETYTENGVPQGSKIGPILYLIYANEMLNILKDCSTFAYADDTAVVVSHHNINSASEIMQKQLNEVSKWCHDNGLVINASKTKVMHIKPPHLTNTYVNIIFHNYQCLHNIDNSYLDACTTKIEQVKTYKYLGVYVDDNFKWLSHIQQLKNAAYSLYHLSNCSTYEVLKQAYFSLVESYIRHGITAWGSSTYCKSLQQTQNQILKILFKNKLHNQQQIQVALIYENSSNRRNHTSNRISQNVNFQNNSADVNSYHVNYNTNNNSVNNVLNNTNINIDSNNFNTNMITNNSYGINNNVNSNNYVNVNNITYNLSTNNVHVSVNNNSQINRSLNNSTHNRRTQNSRMPLIHNLASILKVLNVKSIYYTTLFNEFYNDSRFLRPINHAYSTRQRVEGRFKVKRHKNNYGKNSMITTLPNIFNNLPTNLINVTNIYRRKMLLKKYFILTQ